jgi:hypothetical protein
MENIFQKEANCSHPNDSKSYRQRTVFFVRGKNFLPIPKTADELAEIGGFEKVGENKYEKDSVIYNYEYNTLFSAWEVVENTLTYEKAGSDISYYSTIEELIQKQPESFGMLNGKLFTTMQPPFISVCKTLRNGDTQREFDTIAEAMADRTPNMYFHTINGKSIGYDNGKRNEGRLPYRIGGGYGDYRDYTNKRD